MRCCTDHNVIDQRVGHEYIQQALLMPPTADRSTNSTVRSHSGVPASRSTSRALVLSRPVRDSSAVSRRPRQTRVSASKHVSHSEVLRDGIGIKSNNASLRSWKDLSRDRLLSAEFLYARDNSIPAVLLPAIPRSSLDSFTPVLPLLRILDLSSNALTGDLCWLAHMPALRHLSLGGNRIDSLVGLSDLRHLESAQLSANKISSFAGMQNLPSLATLCIASNPIASFRGLPALPALRELIAKPSPLADQAAYRLSAIAVLPPILNKIDRIPVTDAERDAAQPWRGRVGFAIAEGFEPTTALVPRGNPSTSTVEPELALSVITSEASAFLVALQRAATAHASLSVIWASLCPSSDVHENASLRVAVCLQDQRPFEERRMRPFRSPLLHPVQFSVSGGASAVEVVGSMNDWGPAIPMERVVTYDRDRNGNPGPCQEFWQTTLYLPAGEYEYRYIVDGVERVSESMRAVSAFGRGVCNIWKVCPASGNASDDSDDTLLHVRWLRSNDELVFAPISAEHCLLYTPTVDDIGHCIRAEVLGYLCGSFEVMAFDISPPVQAGPPSACSVELRGLGIEGETLRLEAVYTGGLEGKSEVHWSKVLPNNEERRIVRPNSTTANCEYVPVLEDVGCRIKATYIPVRNDWVSGAPISRLSKVITPALPSLRNVRLVSAHIPRPECEVAPADIVGKDGDSNGLVLTTAPEGVYMQDVLITVSANYVGGVEGPSKIQWYRREEDGGDFYPILGAINKSYTPTLADVGKVIAMQYTPVAADGVEGDPHRALTSRILPQAPQLKSLHIRGDAIENSPLVAVATYFGGHAGQHGVQWVRVDDRGNRVKVGIVDSLTYTPVLRDVGCVIEVIYTPVRSDGCRGAPLVASTTEPVVSGTPTVVSLVLDGDASVGSVLRLKSDYFGGTEGSAEIHWLRSHKLSDRERALVVNGELDESCFSRIPKPSDHERTHRITPDEVGCVIRVVYHPVRSDGRCGEPRYRDSLVIEDVGPRAFAVGCDIVVPKGHHDAHDAHLENVRFRRCFYAGYALRGTYVYHGGAEGRHHHRWLRVRTSTKQSGAGHPEEVIVREEVCSGTSTYMLTDEDVGWRIKYGIMPCRTDGVLGTWTYSDSTPAIAPRIHSDYLPHQQGSEHFHRHNDPQGDLCHNVMGASGLSGGPGKAVVELHGDSVEGKELRGRFRSLDGSADKVQYRWYRAERRNGQRVEILGARAQLEYTPTAADVDHYIVFEVTPVSSQNVKGNSHAAVSNRIQPAAPHAYDPQAHALALGTGNPVISAVTLHQPVAFLECEAKYSYVGGSQGATEFLWERSYDGGLTWEPLPQALLSHSRVHLSADELHAHVRCTVVPVRVDGTKGTGIISKPELVTPPRDVLRILWDKVLLGRCGFNVTSDDGALTRHEIGLRHDGIRIRVTGGPVLVQLPYGTSTITAINQQGRSTSFRINVSYATQSQHFDFRVPRAVDRDIILFAFRLFMGFSTQPIALEILGDTFAHNWSTGMFLKRATTNQGEANATILASALRGRTQFPPAPRSMPKGHEQARQAAVAFKNAAAISK